MAKICENCGKGSMLAGGYSNRVRATKFNPTGSRRQKPNLQWSAALGKTRQLLCAKCIKKTRLLTK